MALSTVSPPALLIAAPASGSGKTLVTLALLRYFRNQGLAVSSFKVGPDYIDPAFHRAASGASCGNLDAWAMGPDLLNALAARAGQNTALTIGEGVMGLFDGATNGKGSTAEVAALLNLPVILVVDVKAQADSAAAVIHGFKTFRGDIDLAGVIFNRVGGPGHEAILRRACGDSGVALLGFLPRQENLQLPSRHLGLVQAREHGGLEDFLGHAANWAREHIDMAALQALARPPDIKESPALPPPLPILGQRIAVARDAAFAFAYPHVLDSWRAAGAEILPFSPLADEAPDARADAVYLPGGYPELHAGQLAGNQTFLGGLRAAAKCAAPIFGECGGYMVLGDGLTDGEGNRHAMAGLLPLETSFAAPRLHLGYRQLRLLADGPLGKAGARFRGHEFHYSETSRISAGEPLFACQDARGTDLGAAGQRRGSVMGSFQHLIAAV